MLGKTIDQLKVGESAEFAKTVSESDIYLYAGITGDFNPAHVNEAYAQNTFFKTRIAHGMLTAGFISAIIANQMPGPGTIYMKQELSFLAPVHIGDTITGRVEILELNLEKPGTTQNRLHKSGWCSCPGRRGTGQPPKAKNAPIKPP